METMVDGVSGADGYPDSPSTGSSRRKYAPLPCGVVECALRVILTEPAVKSSNRFSPSVVQVTVMAPHRYSGGSQR